MVVFFFLYRVWITEIFPAFPALLMPRAERHRGAAWRETRGGKGNKEGGKRAERSGRCCHGDGDVNRGVGCGVRRFRERLCKGRESPRGPRVGAGSPGAGGSTLCSPRGCRYLPLGRGQPALLVPPLLLLPLCLRLFRHPPVCRWAPGRRGQPWRGGGTRRGGGSHPCGAGGSCGVRAFGHSRAEEQVVQTWGWREARWGLRSCCAPHPAPPGTHVGGCPGGGQASARPGMTLRWPPASPPLPPPSPPGRPRREARLEESGGSSACPPQG